MHERCPTYLVALVDITASSKRLANGGNTIWLVANGMAFVDRIDHGRWRLPDEQAHEQRNESRQS